MSIIASGVESIEPNPIAIDIDAITESALNYLDELPKEIFSGTPQSQEKNIELAIQNIYKSLGFEAPNIVLFEDPLQFQIAPLFAHIIQQSQYTNDKSSIKIRKELREYLNLVPRAQSDRISKKVEIILQTMTDKPFGENVIMDLHKRLTEDVRASIAGVLEDKFGSIFKERLERRAQNVLGRSLIRLRLGYRQAVLEQLESKRTEGQSNKRSRFLQIARALYKQNQEAYFGTMPAKDAFGTNSNSWGSWELHWIAAFYAAIFNSGVQASFFDGSIREELNSWMQIFKHGLSCVYLKNVVFVLRYPQVSFDVNTQLHNDSGPAIQFPNGEKWFFWKGICIPEIHIKHRKLLNAMLIDMIENQEVKRALIDMYGWEKYLKSFGSRLVHEDKYGKLYSRGKRISGRTLAETAEPVMGVEVINSTPEPDGTFKRYFLQVPPTLTTAKQAVAWTFGMTEEEYDPIVET